MMPQSRLAPLRRPHPVPPTPSPDVPSVSEVEAFLKSLLGELTEEPSGPPGRGRPRVLPALMLWGALVTCVLEGQPSQRAIWRKLADHGLWGHRGLAISDEAVYRRLARAGVAPLAQLFTQITVLLAARVQPWARAELAPWATGVYAIDESTFDPLARALPLVGAPTGQSLPQLPGKLAACFNLRTQQWERILTTDAPHQNEKVLARQLVADLARGSLVLFDLGYFAFHWPCWSRNCRSIWRAAGIRWRALSRWVDAWATSVPHDASAFARRISRWPTISRWIRP
jgi:hypothetical protein